MAESTLRRARAKALSVGACVSRAPLEERIGRDQVMVGYGLVVPRGAASGESEQKDQQSHLTLKIFSAL